MINYTKEMKINEIIFCLKESSVYVRESSKALVKTGTF